MADDPTAWGAEPAADGPEAWGAQPAQPQREGGIMQTVPQAAGMLGTPEGRTQLWQGVKKLPGDMLQGMLDQFETPGKAVKQGLTSEEETSFGFNTASMMIGGDSIPRAGGVPRITIPLDIAKVAAPIGKAFDDTVIAPAATRLDAYARTGDPNGVRLEPSPPDTVPAPIRPIEGSPFAGIARSVAAKTGIPEVDSVLNSPITKAVIDNPVIDRSHDIPYMAGASNPLNDPTVYIDRHVPKEQTVGGVTFDPADPWTVHENVEQHTMELLTKAGMDDGEAYRVAHFDFAEPAEQAWYRAHGIDQAAAEKEQMTWLPKIQGEKTGGNVPPSLYQKPYPHDHVPNIDHEPVTETKPTPEESARGMDIIRNAPELQPKSAQPMLQQARDLGVIGGDNPSLNELPPKDAARSIAANRAPDDKITGEVGEQPNLWRKNFEATLDKMETPADAKQLILNSLDRNNDFQEARQGKLSTVEVLHLSDVTGLDTASIDPRATAGKIKTNEQMRNVIEAFRAINDKVHEAAQKIAAKGGVDDEAEREAFAKIEMQRDALMDASIEPFVGLRAEFGRLGNVLQEFMKVKRDAGDTQKFIRDATGHGADDVRDRARMIASTPPSALPKVLQLTKNAPPHWFYWMWVQGLISGPITHTKYIAANALYAGTERGIVTPLASILGAFRGGSDKVFIGEAPAMMWGTLRALPDAISTAAQTVKSGARVPLESEVKLRDLALARGETVPALEKAVNPVTQQTRPIPGIWGRIIGTPGDVAGAIHATFKVLGERANLEAWAYNTAAAEGLNPTGADFWDRYGFHRANPTEQVLKDSVYQAYKDTFMQDLGERARSFSAAMKRNPIMQWVVPFAHIPINLMKATYEYTPFAFLDGDMRGNITGKNGGRMQDMAVARMVVGSTVIGYFANKYMQGQANGMYPRDPGEQAAWRLLGKIPNSIAVGDQWVSFDRFGPAGSLAALGADVGSLIHHSNTADEDNWTKLTWMAANTAANLIADAPGFQSVQNIIEALNDERKGSQWAAWQAGSLVPFSSLVSQTASIVDPQMRATRSFLDGLLYRMPGLREDLLPKRDPLYGEPVQNPGYHNIVRSTPINADPVKAELDRLGYYPKAPEQRIGGAKLTPEEYDRYEATAGPLVKQTLSAVIQSPRWQGLQAGQQIQLVKDYIKASRAKAAAAVQMAHPELIQQGIDAKRRQIAGQP